MREILFRARTTKGEWVYGYPNIYDDESINFVVGKLLNSLLPMEDCCINIEYDTLGQFTGLTDKNGKKIFEGDIVQGTIVSAWNRTLIRCEVVYNKDGFISVERTRNQDWVHKVKFAKDIEVIGNIHDNPEILGEQQ